MLIGRHVRFSFVQVLLQQCLVGLKEGIWQIWWSFMSGVKPEKALGVESGSPNPRYTERRTLTINVEHHLPHGGSNGLMKTEPDLSSSSQRMVIALWSGEERAAHWSVPAEEGGERTGKISVCRTWVQNTFFPLHKHVNYSYHDYLANLRAE